MSLNLCRQFWTRGETTLGGKPRELTERDGTVGPDGSGSCQGEEARKAGLASCVGTLLDFYGLNEQPFGVTPDPRYLYATPSHREALAALVYGIEAGRGFMTLIAQPGMGKTTLLFRLLEQYRTSARRAFLFQTQCDSREFLSCLLADLGIETGELNLAQMQTR